MPFLISKGTAISELLMSAELVTAKATLKKFSDDFPSKQAVLETGRAGAKLKRGKDELDLAFAKLGPSAPLDSLDLSAAGGEDIKNLGAITMYGISAGSKSFGSDFHQLPTLRYQHGGVREVFIVRCRDLLA